MDPQRRRQPRWGRAGFEVDSEGLWKSAWASAFGPGEVFLPSDVEVAHFESFH